MQIGRSSEHVLMSASTEVSCMTLNSLLSRKHNTSQTYYFANKISQAIQKSSGIQWKIRLKDALFDSEKIASDFVQKYYEYPKVTKQLSTIIQYYKYYGQKVTLFLGQFYQTLLNNQEKQKLIEYNKLKRLLNLHSKSDLRNEDSRFGNSNGVFCQKIPQGNILSSLDLGLSFHQRQNSAFEESYCVRRLRDILSQHLTKTKRIHKRKRCSLKKIDHDYQKTFNHSVFDFEANLKLSNKQNQKFSQRRANTSIDQKQFTINRKLFTCQKASLNTQKVSKFFGQNCAKISPQKRQARKVNRKRLAYASCQVSKQKCSILTSKNRKINNLKPNKKIACQRNRSKGSEEQNNKENQQQSAAKNIENLNINRKTKKKIISSNFSNKSLTGIQLWRKSETQCSYKTSYLNSCMYTPKLISESNNANIKRNLNQHACKQKGNTQLRNQKDKIKQQIRHCAQFAKHSKAKCNQRILLESVGQKKKNLQIQIDQKNIKESICQIKNAIRNKKQRLKNKHASTSDVHKNL